MKKLLLALILVGIIFGAASESLAGSYYDISLQKQRVIASKWERLHENIMNLAEQITIHNKPAFEVTLSKRERSYNDEYYGVGMTSAMFSRIWAKDKTIVSGWSNRDKKFHVEFFTTADPAISFAGGIRVGANVKMVEKFFNTTLDEVSIIAYQEGKGIYYGSDDRGFFVYILHNKNGIITEISTYQDALPGGFPAPFTSRAEAFYKKMRRQLGFPKSLASSEGNFAERYYD